jgi:PAS domain S-box-containing protein
MPDDRQPTDALISELDALRRRNAELEAQLHDQRSTTKDLRTDKARYCAVFERASDAIFIEDRAENIIDVNPQAEVLTGYSREALLQMTTAALQPPDQRGRNPRADGRFETTIVHRDGHHIPVEIAQTTLSGETEGLFLAIVRDITTRRQADAERDQLIIDLDSFAQTVAHDLKNPLNNILNSIEMLGDDLSIYPPDAIRQILNIAGRSTHKALNIVHELLLLAGVRQMEEVPLTPLDMSPIVQEALDRLVYMIREYDAHITLPTRWPQAVGYAPWVEEIWTNYISNAIKYGGEPPQITLGADPPQDGMVRFWVRDNGPGIPSDKQARLFVPFSRLDQAQSKGHGLGLSIVMRIVERLGGEVGMNAGRGRGRKARGTTFYFLLPAV